MPATQPSKTNLEKTIKSFLLRPSITSFFQVEVKAPSGAASFFSDNRASIGGNQERNLLLYCSDAVLPGSSLLTHENNDDFHGVTERFAYRRAYDDRIDLSYYVNGSDHYSIRFFETWIKYVANEEQSKVKTPGYSYRFRFPDGTGGYRKDSSLFVTKFERDYTNRMVYEFVKPYPIAIQSMPVSYDSSQLLKCTVSMTYTAYILDANSNSISGSSQPGQSTANTVPNNPFELTPQQQADYNAAYGQNFNLGNLSPGSLTNTTFSSPSFSAPLPDPLTNRGDRIV